MRTRRTRLRIHAETLAREHDAWLLQDKLLRDLDVLLRWATATLPAPVCPCVCTDAGCIRCEAERVVGERQALTMKPAPKSDAATVLPMKPVCPDEPPPF
jgi:hypothetical protein